MAKTPIRWGTAATRRLFSAASAPAVQKPPPPVSTRTAMVGEAKKSKPLYRRLSELGRAPEGSVAKVLNKWLREGRAVTAVKLMDYVKDLRKYRRYQHALELMDWMVKTRGMNMSHTNHAIRLDLVSKVKGLDSAEEYFSSLPDRAKNERTYGALLNCYCSKKMADKAVALYEKMKGLNLASSTLVHNNLMSLYMKLGQPEKVLTQFQKMIGEFVSPDNLTCCILMNSYAAMDDIDSVERVIQEMEEGGEVILQWSAYSTLAAIYSSAGLLRKADSALKKLEELMDSRELEPFHFLISLYAGLGNLEEVHRVWKSLKTTFRKPTNMSYLIMLQALNNLDDLEGMIACFDEWDSVDVSYDPRLMNQMIGAYLRKGMIKEAESLWGKASEKNAGFDHRTCDFFLDYYLKSCEMGMALKWLEAAASIAEQDEWKLSKEKVKAFLESFEKSKDVEGAEKFFRSLKTLSCLDSEVYESLIRTYSAAGRAEPLLRQRIKEDNIKLSPETKKLLDRVCRSGGR